MDYVFVTGDGKVTAPIKYEYYTKKILQWIGFTTKYQRDSIYDDSINSFSGIRTFKIKDISDLSTEFSGMTQDNAKINFGMLRTKRIKSPLHWMQYFYHISGDMSIINLSKVVFIQQLDTALQREEIRKNLNGKSNKRVRKLLRIHWSHNRNGKSEIQTPSIIFPHLLR